MSQLIIITSPVNSGDGTPLATAFNYCNSNFSELYARAQVTPPATLIGSVGDQAGMYAYDSSYFYYCFANYDGSSVIWAQVTQVADVSLAAITNGDSNVKLVGPNGDATVNINGVSNIAAFRSTGAYISGAVSATGDITGSNVSGIFVLGNNVIGNTVSATGNVLALNAFVSGGVNAGTGFLATDQYPAEFFADGIALDYDSANSTARISTGTNDSIIFYNDGVGNTQLVSINPSGNIATGGGFVSTGNIATQGIVSAVGNIVTDGYFVGTFVGNVTGNFVIPGSNTQVVFNTSGNADAVGGFTYNKDSNTMTVLGVVSAAGNVVSGNVLTGGLISATGNITGGNLTTLGIVSSAGNILANNNILTGFVSATGNVRGSNLLTTGIITATGNITGGNLVTSGSLSTIGIISAAGNIRTSNYLFVGQDINAGGDVTATSYTGTSSSLVGNVTGGNIFTSGRISATGNVIGNYILGNIALATGFPPDNIIQNGNSNVSIASSAGNVLINVNSITAVATFTPFGQNTIGNISATGNVTSGNLNTGGSISSTGNITGGNLNTYIVNASGTVTGSGLNTAGTISATGNIAGGNLAINGLISATGAITGTTITGTSLTVGTGSITGGNIINSNANGVGNIGSSTTYFNTVFAKATSAQYADLAENYASDIVYDAGTVVIFGGTAEITTTKEFADVRVAGAISTDPAYLMNSGASGLPLALRGRIPVKVIGPVNKGDLLVTAGDNPGYAISIGQNTNYPLAVFAKSIETNTDEGVKLITAVII